MNVEEFRHQTRSTLEAALNQLQAATLLVSELEMQIASAGRTVQNLTQIVEAFIDAQPDSGSDVTRSDVSDNPNPDAY